jgi:hypothetical protein
LDAHRNGLAQPRSTATSRDRICASGCMIERTTSLTNTAPAATQARASAANRLPEPIIPAATHEPLREIESADALHIVDSSSKELFDELNAKRKRFRFWPGVGALLGLVLFFGMAKSWPPWALWTLILLGCAVVAVVATWDRLRKTTVIFYELEPALEATYQQLLAAAGSMGRCGGVWHIGAQGRVLDRKYHAGANHLVNRMTTSIGSGEPPYVKSNMRLTSIGVGRQTIYLFPDRALIFDANGVGAVTYGDLLVRRRATQFIESDTPPRDAEVVGRTWRYVNKRGGPDKRFKDNRELPICLYEEVEFSSPSGLNEVIQLSRHNSASEFVEALAHLALAIPREVVR